MTLRERLADWISGGALTQARKEIGLWEAMFNEEQMDHRETWLRLMEALK